MNCVVALSNFPDRETAESIARILVHEKLAACVNLCPGVTSIYRWEGAVELAEEVTALMKTTESAYPELEARLNELHPYEVPEILKLLPQGGLDSYLRWVSGAVAASPTDLGL